MERNPEPLLAGLGGGEVMWQTLQLRSVGGDENRSPANMLTVVHLFVSPIPGQVRRGVGSGG